MSKPKPCPCWPGHPHSPFEYCDCCGKPGNAYFGDKLLGTIGGRTNTYKLTRHQVLELILEWIEANAVDGRTFDTTEVFRGVPVWYGQCGACLRWLVHIGILEQINRPGKGRKNYWRVRTDNGYQEGRGSGE